MRLAITLLLLLGLPASIHAQTVRGHLLSRDANAGVPGGTVHLVGADSQVVAHSRTDATGAFALQAPRPGRYFLLAEAAGYEASETDYIAVGAEGKSVSFVIGKAPVRLASLQVDARANSREDRLWYGGFYQRMNARGTSGRFFAREQIDREMPQSIADILRRVPSLDVRTGGQGEFAGRRLLVRPRAQLSIRTACWSTFYLNGMRVEPEAVEALDTSEIEGVEVYANGGVPAQFNVVGSACGVIVVWLRAR
ncbi:MAG TPA: carboxypeptidase regulatory-like domain-containing protein [Longimicrobium sp.]|nr:carboxypeptidase regulatory-like domain-containing protein [Longimicrobium sp.]